jgi:hypothetical protein
MDQQFLESDEFQETIITNSVKLYATQLVKLSMSITALSVKIQTADATITANNDGANWNPHPNAGDQAPPAAGQPLRKTYPKWVFDQLKSFRPEPTDLNFEGPKMNTFFNLCDALYKTHRDKFQVKHDTLQIKYAETISALKANINKAFTDSLAITGLEMINNTPFLNREGTLNKYNQILFSHSNKIIAQYNATAANNAAKQVTKAALAAEAKQESLTPITITKGTLQKIESQIQQAQKIKKKDFRKGGKRDKKDPRSKNTKPNAKKRN